MQRRPPIGAFLPGKDELPIAINAVKAWVDKVTAESEITPEEALSFLMLRVSKEYESNPSNPHEPNSYPF